MQPELKIDPNESNISDETWQYLSTNSPHPTWHSLKEFAGNKGENP